MHNNDDDNNEKQQQNADVKEKDTKELEDKATCGCR